VGRWLAFLGISAAGALVIVSRRPDAILNPQFWAEDGTIWYAEAHAHGLRSLLSPYLGYFQTLPRVVAVAAQILPLTWAPLVFNLVAVALMLLPVWLLASQGFARLASPRVRLGFGFLILALPNTHSMCANVTNSQWYLALAAVLVLLAESSEAPAFDLTVLGLCAVSGPFAVFLAPVAALMWWKRKTGNATSRRRDYACMLILAAGCLLQGLAMWLTRSHRPRVAPGASPLRLAQILAVNVFLTPVLGGHAALPYVHPGAAIVLPPRWALASWRTRPFAAPWSCGCFSCLPAACWPQRWPARQTPIGARWPRATESATSFSPCSPGSRACSGCFAGLPSRGSRLGRSCVWFPWEWHANGAIPRLRT